MSGYVVKRICEKLACEGCKLSLKGHQKQGLICTREYNSEQKNIVYPSFLIVLFVLQNLFSEANCKRIGSGKKYFFDYVNIKIVDTFISLHSVMMKTMDNHCYDLLKKQHYEFLILSIDRSIHTYTYFNVPLGQWGRHIDTLTHTYTQ